jgi:outer membrane lipoprotein SlyB
VVRHFIAAAVVLLAGCALGLPGGDSARDEPEVRLGVVESVRQVPLPGSGGIIGTIGGATVGGVAGGAVGSGRGSSAGSVFGTVVGSVAGRALESAATAKEGLEISVRLDSGRLIAIVQPDDVSFKLGEHVRVVTGAKGSRVTH